MIFINCINEGLIQVNDKTRIDVSRSFVSGEGITDIEIEPEAAAGFVSVYNSDQDKWFLDWQYSMDGEKVISVRATDGTSTITQTFSITVISVEDDNLYSNDAQLFAIESELKRYLPPGKSSFTYLHREAQSRILAYLDRKRIWNDDGEPYNKNQINLFNQLQKWSLYETAYIIYNDLFITVGDKFSQKINQYKALRNIERDRAALRIDKDNTGTYDRFDDTVQDLKSLRIVRR